MLTENKGLFDDFIRFFPSILSLGTLNLLGYPFGTEEYTVKIDASAYDLNGNLLAKHKVDATEFKFIACYYGYEASQVQAAACLAAYKGIGIYY
ncbi:MAG: hypothetical protein ACLU99_11260 [Alphaproteobacteria bacterium]